MPTGPHRAAGHHASDVEGTENGEVEAGVFREISRPTCSHTGSWLPRFLDVSLSPSRSPTLRQRRMDPTAPRRAFSEYTVTNSRPRAEDGPTEEPLLEFHFEPK
jgi:hypothetical protein